MRETELMQLRSKIIDEIRSLEEEIAKTEAKNIPIAQDCSLDSLNREDMTLEQELNKKIIKNATLRVKKLKTALEHITGGEYGVCVECEEDIAFARLMLLPESTHCVACMNELGL